MPRNKQLSDYQWNRIIEVMNKGLDITFVHYGIRKDDMQLIESLANEAELDADWLKELLKNYHEKRVKDQEIEDKTIEKIIEQALNKLQ